MGDLTNRRAKTLDFRQRLPRRETTIWCVTVGVRQPNYRLVKVNFTYSISELASLLRVHKNTVHGWHANGLRAVEEKRPYIFRGSVVRAFLEVRRKARKQPCRPGMIYCLPCREPKRPAGDMVDLLPFDTDTGNLRGICPDCDRLIHRRVNLSRIASAVGDLSVSERQAEQPLTHSYQPSVRCEFGQRGSP